MSVRPIAQVGNGSLICYGETNSQFGIVYKPFAGSNIGILSLSTFRMDLALNEIEEPKLIYSSVAVYGVDYFIVPRSPCEVRSHIVQLQPGTMVVNGADIHLVVPDDRSAFDVKCINIATAKVTLADGLPGVGCFNKWDITVRTLPNPVETAVLYSYSCNDQQ